MKISAVIPTRGDVLIGQILDRLTVYSEIDEVIIARGDTPFNRYLAAARAKNDVIYTQDDDCLTDVRPLITAFVQERPPHRPPLRIVNAMTPAHAAQYPGAETLIGFGAIFERSLLDCFASFTVRDALFYRESDRIFATVNPHVSVFPTITLLPHATAANRLYRQPDHVSARLAMEQRICEVTGIRAS